MSYPEHIERELRKARRAIAHLDGDVRAQIDAAVKYALSQMNPDFANLEKALGVKLDGGSFMLGMQCAAFAFDNTNVNLVIANPAGRAMLLEMLAGARKEGG